MTIDSMPLIKLLQKQDDGDFLRAVVEAVLQLMMEADVEGVIGAGRHERANGRGHQGYDEEVYPPDPVREHRQGSNRLHRQSNIYKSIGREFARHDWVMLRFEEWSRGDVSTNTIKGFFSIFKRGMRGVYQRCGKQHLHCYLAEFDFRYSNRKALGIEDNMRAGIAFRGIVGKLPTNETIGA